MNANSFSDKFREFFKIQSIQEPVISSTGVVLSKLVFVPVNKEGIPCGSYFFSPSHLKWLYKHGEQAYFLKSSDFSHVIGVQML